MPKFDCTLLPPPSSSCRYMVSTVAPPHFHWVRPQTTLSKERRMSLPSPSPQTWEPSRPSLWDTTTHSPTLNGTWTTSQWRVGVAKWRVGVAKRNTHSPVEGTYNISLIPIPHLPSGLGMRLVYSQWSSHTLHTLIERFQHVITILYTRNKPPFWCTTCTVCY